mgnify:FL=1
MYWRLSLLVFLLVLLVAQSAWANNREAAKNHLERAHRCVDENDLKRAEQHIRRSLKLKNSIAGRVFLGWLFKKTKRANDALSILRKTSIASSPQRVQRELKRLDKYHSKKSREQRLYERKRRESAQRPQRRPVRPRPTLKAKIKKPSAPPPKPADTTSKEFLIGGLSAASYEVKRHSMLELARLGYKDTLDRVAQLLQHPNTLVRGGAAEALGKFGDDKGIVPLLEALWVEKDISLVKVIIEALEKIGSEKALNGLYQYRYDNEHPKATEDLDFAIDRLMKKHKTPEK